MSRLVLALPSPPTANGDLHLGHLAGPYLAADAFARYRRMRGDAVAYVTGADVHQSYVVRMAERNGTTPECTADGFATRIEETLRMADIEVSAFVRPHRSAQYQTFVHEFFRRLADRGHLVAEERPVLWCSSCCRHLLGAAVRGLCGGCGLGSDGALCEHCGRPVEPANLRAPRCARCGTPAILRPMRRLFFPLEKFAGTLREFHTEARMRLRSRQVVDTLLRHGLFDTAVTSPGAWGLPVPAADFEDQRLDVWAEVGPGYAASTQAFTATAGEPDGWRDYWCSDHAEIVQFFGFDNTVPHALLYPALYWAHGDMRPPDRFVVNEFHRLDGDKFSTSRRHAVWGGDILAVVPADVLRYYLCLTAPEDEEGNFALTHFRETVNRDLASTIGPLLDDMLRAAASGSLTLPTDQCAELVKDLRDRASALGHLLEPDTFSLRRAARAWRDMAMSLRSWFERARAESRDAVREPARRTIVVSLSLLAGCANPLMPDFARRLWKALGATDDLRVHPLGESARRLGQTLVPPDEGTWFPEVTEEQLRPLSGKAVPS